jgi:hypothetical protein
MTEEHMIRAIQAIHNTFDKAMRSKKATRQFLIDAGIIPDIIPDKKKKKEKKS